MATRMIRWIAATLACAAALSSHGVRIDPSGLGQALIYPYYSARIKPDGSYWNFFLSVVNTSPDARAVKVRFREALHGRIALEFNLYLGPGDEWTGVLIPASRLVDTDTVLVTADLSCTDPPIPAQGILFSTNAFTGTASDGADATPSRKAEGWVEMIEMATLTGASANAADASMGTGGAPACGALIGPGKARQLNPPEGGLYGGGYFIDVQTGLASSYAAIALADLTTDKFYSDPGQPGTDFDSPQVTPLSVVVLPSSSASAFGDSSQGYLLRSEWSRGVDAVSAVLMTATLANEYVLDATTQSNTDWSIAFPTARFYTDGATATPPFTRTFSASGACEAAFITVYNRDQDGNAGINPPGPQAGSTLCWASSVVPWSNASLPWTIGTTSRFFGSKDLGITPYSSVKDSVRNGFAMLSMSPQGPGLTSLPSSTAIDLSTGAVIPGAHKFAGLPAVGFGSWSFDNGLLNCNGKVCKGTFGVDFAHVQIQGVTRIAP
jgi:hypothetical protein